MIDQILHIRGYGDIVITALERLINNKKQLKALISYKIKQLKNN